MTTKITVFQTKRGDWLVQEEHQHPDGQWRSGRQLARFEDENEALGYAEEARAYQAQTEAEIKARMASPLPATPVNVDPFNHPAFWMIEIDDHDTALAAIREALTPEQLVAPDWHRQWAATEIIVDEGYESPYQFGRLLRQMMDDDNAVIFRYNPRRIYFAMATGSNRVAYYDPAKREHAPELPADPGDIDWFAAVDALAAPPTDLITQAQAAELGAPSVQAVNNAIRDGRLTGYNNPDAEHQRQGKTLVSRSAVERLWNTKRYKSPYGGYGVIKKTSRGPFDTKEDAAAVVPADASEVKFSQMVYNDENKWWVSWNFMDLVREQ
jgi:hypothetical protein